MESIQNIILPGTPGPRPAQVQAQSESVAAPRQNNETSLPAQPGKHEAIGEGAPTRRGPVVNESESGDTAGVPRFDFINILNDFFSGLPATPAPANFPGTSIVEMTGISLSGQLTSGQLNTVPDMLPLLTDGAGTRPPAPDLAGLLPVFFTAQKVAQAGPKDTPAPDQQIPLAPMAPVIPATQIPLTPALIIAPENLAPALKAGGAKDAGAQNGARDGLSPDVERTEAPVDASALKTSTLSAAAQPQSTPVASVNAAVQDFSQLLQAQPAAGADIPVPADKTPNLNADGLIAVMADRSATPRAAGETQPAHTAPPAHPPSPPVRELAIQITQHMQAGLNRFQMRLDPPELGRIEVRMEISPEGKLTAVIAVDRPETLDLLQRDGRALERSLLDAGIKTDSSALNFSLRGGRQDGGQAGNQNAPSPTAGADWLNDISATPEISATLSRFASRAVNIQI